MLRRLTRYHGITNHISRALVSPHYHQRYTFVEDRKNQFDRESVGALDELERTFVRPDFFYKHLKDNDFHFFCGVPDSVLKDLCGYFEDNIPSAQHKIVPNEGSAIGLASGYYLNTGKIPVVYFQNSGLGNAVNPLLSLTHQNVYSIPMLLIVGWRGEVGKKDEPQHLVMGNVMCDMLKLMQIPYDVLPDYEEGIQHSVQTAAQYLRTNSAPYALLVRKRTFDKYEFDPGVALSDKLLSRKEALRIIVNNLDPNSPIVSTTGFASRELYEVRQEYQDANDCARDDIKEFLTVGAMGHASAIALGIAGSTSSKRDIICIDGDGALLMHMGSMSMIGNSGAKNIKHILINNGCHDSVGGQPTNANYTDFVKIAQGCGYKQTKSVETEEEITEAIRTIHEVEGPYFLEIHTNYGAAKNLSRPKSSPAKNKHDFMAFIDKTKQDNARNSTIKINATCLCAVRSFSGKQRPKIKKTTQLRQMLQSSELEFIMEAHNGMSAIIAQEAGFDALWASGLCISASMGVRDSNEASWTQVLDVLEFMSDATSIPILLDGDTGYGNFNNARRLVQKLEQRDIAGVCLEDKIFPKTNSFISVEGGQPLADSDEFALKLMACKEAQTCPDFNVIARTEAFISGWGIDEALQRAELFADFGADAILMHSKINNVSEIESFMKVWDNRKPVVIVPTKYYTTPTDIFRELGVSTVIWANHSMRASVKAMQNIVKEIYESQSLAKVEEENMVVAVNEIFRLTNQSELKQAEKRYLPQKGDESEKKLL